MGGQVGVESALAGSTFSFSARLAWRQAPRYCRWQYRLSDAPYRFVPNLCLLLVKIRSRRVMRELLASSQLALAVAGGARKPWPWPLPIDAST